LALTSASGTGIAILLSYRSVANLKADVGALGEFSCPALRKLREFFYIPNRAKFFDFNGPLMNADLYGSSLLK
jgi:hypothetical protein